MSKVKKIIALIVCIVCIFSMFCISASAYTYYEDYTSISVPISKPTVSDNFSYVELVCESRDPYILRGYVFLISFYETSNPSCRIEFGNNKNIKFFNGSDGIMSVYCVSSNGKYYSQGQSLVQGSYVEESFDFPIVSVKYYGSVFSTNASQYNNSSVVINYGTDNEANFLLSTILEVLRSNSNSMSQQIQNDNTNANNIQQNQNENTDKIIGNQNELYDKEKDEITNSGNSSSESIDDIPNQSEGFLSSLTNLTNAMSYNGTECKWKLPNVYIPAISNIVPRIDLIPEKDIDFGFWVERIPSNILSLIRAVCTLALIVFCFKELYNTISYVLTLKGGND